MGAGERFGIASGNLVTGGAYTPWDFLYDLRAFQGDTWTPWGWVRLS